MKTLFDEYLTIAEVESLLINGASLGRDNGPGRCSETGLYRVVTRGPHFADLILKRRPDELSLFAEYMYPYLAKEIIRLKPHAIYERDKYGCSVVHRCDDIDLLEYYYTIAPEEFSPYKFDQGEIMVSKLYELSHKERLSILEIVDSLVEFRKNKHKYSCISLQLFKNNKDFERYCQYLASDKTPCQVAIELHSKGKIALARSVNTRSNYKRVEGDMK